jgi:hypothetical protein
MQQLLNKQYISLDDDLHKDYIARDININEHLEAKDKKLIEDSLYMQIGMWGVLGFLYVAPESVSKWSDEQKELSNLGSKYKQNIKDGPVIDEDDFAINYIGHPVSGAYYYVVARHDGYGWFGSFMYSTFVSTFVWEYGYEALAEIPSIQDLISTPIVGALMGEGMYHLEKKLDKNGGLVFGSRTFGNVCYALLNPFGRLAESLNFGGSAIMRFQTYQVSNAYAKNQPGRILDMPSPYDMFNYGFVIKFEF